MKRTAVVVALFVWIGAMPGATSQPDALALLREALGGEAALNAIRTIRARGTIERKPYKDNIEIAVALPDQFLRTVRYFRRAGQPKWPARGYDVHDIDLRRTDTLIEVYGVEESGTQVSGFSRMMPLPEPGWLELEQNPGSVERRLDSARVRFAEFVLPLLGNTSPAYAVDATSESNTITFRSQGSRSWRLDLDPVTHLPSRMTWRNPVPPQARASAKPSRLQIDFSEFRTVGSVRWPRRLIKRLNDALYEDTHVERYELNLNLKIGK